jgi:hypothetical protein
MALVNQYIAVDYLEFDYFLENQQFSSAFTVSAASPSDQASLGDYSWDDFAESNVIDRTWDEWFGDSWESRVLFSRFTAAKVLGGYLQQPTITTSSSFSVSVNANYTTGIPQTISSAFEQADTFFDRFRGIAVSGQAQNFDSTITTSVDGNFTTGVPQNITTIFTHSTNANYTTGIPQTFSSAFTKSTNANYTTGIPQSLLPQFTQSVDATALFDLAYGQIFNALYSTLTVGRLIGLPDPWNILTVLQETRTILVPIESMDIKVLAETRVNKAKTETRSLLVPQETRSYKIRKPIMTSQSVIPRVRVER